MQFVWGELGNDQQGADAMKPPTADDLGFGLMQVPFCCGCNLVRWWAISESLHIVECQLCRMTVVMEEMPHWDDYVCAAGHCRAEVLESIIVLGEQSEQRLKREIAALQQIVEAARRVAEKVYPADDDSAWSQESLSIFNDLRRMLGMGAIE